MVWWPALVAYDPESEAFIVYPLPSSNAQVRRLFGRADEVWGAESGADKLVVIRS